ncbi:hypothetical protein Lal_00036242 [Lupinus albus]|nr:hypothetical protein Lal_00036242 [Lupinus albus]
MHNPIKEVGYQSGGLIHFLMNKRHFNLLRVQEMVHNQRCGTTSLTITEISRIGWLVVMAWKGAFGFKVKEIGVKTGESLEDANSLQGCKFTSR